MAWLEYKEKQLKQFIKAVLAGSSAERQTWLAGDCKRRECILDLHVLKKQNERMYILINGTNRDISSIVRTKEKLRFVKDLRNGQEVNIMNADTVFSFSVKVDSWDYAVFKAEL